MTIQTARIGTLLSLFASFLVLTGCGMFDSVKQAGNSAENLEGITTDVNSKVTDMKEDVRGVTEDVDHITSKFDELETQLAAARQALAKQMRQECQEDLDRATSFEEKAAHAACIFKAQEFQVFSDTSTEAPAKRTALFESSLREFFFIIKSYGRREIHHQDIAPFAANNIFAFYLQRSGLLKGPIAALLGVERAGLTDRISYYAIATATQEVNENQAALLAANEQLPQEVVSFNDLLLDGLSYVTERNNLESEEERRALRDGAPGYVIEFDRNLHEGVELLKTRVVSLTITSLIYLARLPYQRPFDAGTFILARKFGAKEWRIAPNERDLTASEIEEYAKRIGWAAEVQEKLVEFGEPAAFDGLGRNIIQGMRFPDPTGLNGEQREAIEKLKHQMFLLKDLTPSI